LVKAEAAQIASYRAIGVEGHQVVGAQDPAAVLEITLIDLQGSTKAAEP